MRLAHTIAAGLAAALLPLGALTSAAPAGAAPAETTASTITTAPYIDVTQSTPTLPNVAAATGQKTFTLAFALASSAGCTPMWGGITAIDDPGIIGQIDQLRSAGGDVIVATGGAQGPYLENTCSSADDLLGAYEKILDTTGSNHLDIDVEATIPEDTVNQALAKLQAERGTKVSYTLRVQSDDTGVDPYSLQVLQSAADHGVDVLVNPMTMEFSSTQDWGDAVISAAQSTLTQMGQVWPNLSQADLKARLGVTPMIGRNYNGKIFTTDDAHQLVDWASTNKIGRLSFWSVGRDNGGCPGGAVSATCSSIDQSDYEFTSTFKDFSG